MAGAEALVEVEVPEPSPSPPKRLGVGAGAVVAALLAGAVVAAGFTPNKVLTAGVVVVVLTAVSAGLGVAAPPPKRLDDGVDEAAPVEGFPNRLGVPVDAGAADVPLPKRLGVAALLAAGVADGVVVAPPPKRLGVGLGPPPNILGAAGFDSA